LRLTKHRGPITQQPPIDFLSEAKNIEVESFSPRLCMNRLHYSALLAKWFLLILVVAQAQPPGSPVIRGWTHRLLATTPRPRPPLNHSCGTQRSEGKDVKACRSHFFFLYFCISCRCFALAYARIKAFTSAHAPC
jgi:hypothetical protein